MVAQSYEFTKKHQIVMDELLRYVNYALIKPLEMGHWPNFLILSKSTERLPICRLVRKGPSVGVSEMNSLFLNLISGLNQKL